MKKSLEVIPSEKMLKNNDKTIFYNTNTMFKIALLLVSVILLIYQCEDSSSSILLKVAIQQ